MLNSTVHRRIINPPLPVYTSLRMAVVATLSAATGNKIVPLMPLKRGGFSGAANMVEIS